VSKFQVDGKELRRLESFEDVDDATYVALSNAGYVIVCDKDNDRILLLNDQMKLERVIADHRTRPVHYFPSHLHYDHANSRLYVAHHNRTYAAGHPRGVIISLWSVP